MKVPDSKETGGRIRYARMKQGITIKMLAEQAEMSSNYLSTVERGENAPSDALLQRMADILDVSFDYLKNGDTMDEADEDSVDTITMLPAADYNADATLFLNIASKYSIVAGNKSIAKAIDCPEDELTKILSNTMPANLTPENYFEIADEMDIAAALRGCSDLYETLQAILVKQKLRDALRKHVNEKYGGRSFYKFVGHGVEKVEEYALENGEIFTVTSLIIRFTDSKSTERTFKHLYLNKASEEQIIAVLKKESYDDQHTCLVFTDEALLNDFKNCGERYAEEQTTLKSEAGMSVPSEYWGNVSLAFFNVESGSIEEQYFDCDE